MGPRKRAAGRMTTEDRIISLAKEILEQARTSSDISYRAEMLAALQHACDILGADRPDGERGALPKKD